MGPLNKSDRNKAEALPVFVSQIFRDFGQIDLDIYLAGCQGKSAGKTEAKLTSLKHQGLGLGGATLLSVDHISHICYYNYKSPSVLCVCEVICCRALPCVCMCLCLS